MKSFLISPRDMLEKMKLEFEAFKDDNKSSRHAMNFLLTAYHLKEWVWKSYLENNHELRSKISSTLHDEKDYFCLLNLECSEMKYIRELANNTKHFYSKEPDKILETKPDGLRWEDDFSWGDDIAWEYDGFMIITKDNHRIPALTLFQKVRDYWINSFDKFFNHLL